MMNRVCIPVLSMLLAIMASCVGGSKKTGIEGGIVEENLYAKGYEIIHYNGFTTVEIANPWDTTKILQRYVLVEKGVDLPRNLPEGTLIRTPLDNIIMYTTLHASIWEKMGALDAVKGICESEYLTSEKAIAMVKEGKISDCGSAFSPNVETIMEVDGEIIVASPYENSGYGQAEKLGIPIFESADYMEHHPLGRVEWLKVYGLLQGKRDIADSMFNATMNRYNSLKELAQGELKKPRIMSERKYGASWYIVGGASYMATMYRDAGADYIFSDNTESGSATASFETVYEKGGDSDIWILKYAAENKMTYNHLQQENPLYANFAPFKNRRMFACNTLTTPYYEYIAIHPDIILADYVKMFHPHLLPDYSLVCYEPIGE
jgi:iron complex transport system substrate-binding protein